MLKRVFVFDTTLPDGEQSPGCSTNLDEILQMARQTGLSWMESREMKSTMVAVL
jgi:isopropylmalate/homocitrate/citramalate synthase